MAPSPTPPNSGSESAPEATFSTLISTKPTEALSSSESEDGSHIEVVANRNGDKPNLPDGKTIVLDLEEGTNSKDEDDDDWEAVRSIGSRTVSKRTCRLGSALCGLLLLGGAFTVIYFYVILDGDVNNLPITLDGIFDQDPFDAVGPEESNRWRNSGNGLNLPVVNALSGTQWQGYFDEAIANWDNGYPDAIDLQVTQSASPDPDCQPQQGVVVVCNGNYGRTPWKGRAEILSSQTGTILAASARVNEFYLRPSISTDEMRYAMCHELGHAWGLHHTDESFTNRDLGNCMDYTNRHRNNLTPDYSNYAFLHALYGLVPGAAPYNPPTAAPTIAPTASPVVGGSSGGFNNNPPFQPPGGNGGGFVPPAPPSGNNDDKKDDKKDKKNKDNKDRSLLAWRHAREVEKIQQQGRLPEWLLEAVRAAREDESYVGMNEVIELPQGFVMHIHQLPAN